MGEHAHSGHGHSHAPKDFGRAFAIGVGLNTAYVVAEAFWGVTSHSMALLADAGHNLGDVVGLLGAWGASWLSKRGPSQGYTYGLRRSSILSALANAILLLIATGAIAWEAIRRLIHPEPSGGLVIVIVGLVGVVLNGVTAWLFMKGRKGDLNIRAAFVHMAADASLTLAVAIAGGVIMLTGWERLDPAVSLVVAAAIVVGTWHLLRDSVNLSLDAVPRGIDQNEVESYLRVLPGVMEVHDLHIWGLSTTDTALTAHLVRQEPDPAGELLNRVRHDMQEQFQIGHATIQLETPEAARRCELRPDHVV
ncbi:MAG: cation diffusion facilitator family transporter [Acetobacteraceae bacterium]|nr:cation diffusion facilitator family transporter [Acetobacteraceae bacterium]